MSDFLQTMAGSSAARAAALHPAIGDADFDRPVHSLMLDRFDVIAEIKNRSPAEGELAAHGASRAERARAYAAAGAAAISVLTEPDRFDGDISHLEEVVAAAGAVPVMRKDFLVDVAQVQEARVAGASGVLLIAAMLDNRALRDMLDCAFEHGMFVLLEAFGDEDVARINTLFEDAEMQERAASRQLLVGVNSRNLRTLAVDPARLEDFAPRLPRQAIRVAESGLNSDRDAARVAGQGYDMAHVGTALMRAGDPGRLLRAMIDAGRSARS